MASPPAVMPPTVSITATVIAAGRVQLRSPPARLKRSACATAVARRFSICSICSRCPVMTEFNCLLKLWFRSLIALSVVCLAAASCCFKAFSCSLSCVWVTLSISASCCALRSASFSLKGLVDGPVVTE
eukprot:55748-Eustigmatos_ZCMA.PRE.2